MHKTQPTHNSSLNVDTFINYQNQPDKQMVKEFNIIIEQGEDGYLIAEVIGLPGCHTQAKTQDELIKRTKEAIRLYLKCQKEPFEISEKFIGIQKLAI